MPKVERSSSVLAGQTVADLVTDVALVLRRAGGGIEDPIREARDLIAALLDVPRHWPLLRANKWLDGVTWQSAREAARKRASGAPLAYAVGRASFRALTLAVDERVLIPRPETELLVDLVLARQRTGVAIDVGTGSGAIAISLAIEGSFDRVVGIDISTDALEVARENASQTGAGNIDFRAGDLLQASGVGRQTSEGASVIVCNPPYISYDELAALPSSVRDWEPAIALSCGGGGLSVTARLVRQAAAALAPSGLLALEVDARRAALVAELVASDTRYADVRVHLDLTGRERFVLATLNAHGTTHG